MDHEKICHINDMVRKALAADPRRYTHSVAVANTAMCLAARHGADLENAYIAGLLHDNAKCIDYVEQKAMCRRFDIELSNLELSNPYLIHGKLGAYLAKMNYGIDNISVCEAIKWHTTGKPSMNTLESVIFISDYIEPMRHHADNLDRVRCLAFEDLSNCVSLILSDTIRMLKANNRPVDPMAIRAHEYYTRSQF